MAHARASVVLHPLANSLANKMRGEMGIPSTFAPTAYGFSTIAANYRKIGEAWAGPWTPRLGAGRPRAAEPLLVSPARQAPGRGVQHQRRSLRAGPLPAESGLDVAAVFARGTLPPFEWDYIARLRELRPELAVYNVSHPALPGQTAAFADVDEAYGVDAGIFCANAVNVPLSRYQEQKYGYETALWMLEQTHEALRNPVSNHDWIYKHQFLI
jgi:nitrogenase molybdenum-cofactor synthesis protein NifE